MSDLAPTNESTLIQFLYRWYGEPIYQEIEAPPPSGAPPELIRWHDLYARWGRRIAPQNHPVPLNELKAENGKYPFWIENQGTWMWAYDPAQLEHPVFDCEPDVPDENSMDWSETGETLSQFLIHATIVEAIYAAPVKKFASRVPASWNESIAHGVIYPLPPWNGPGSKSFIYTGDNWLALVTPEPDGLDVDLSATELDHLNWVEDMPEIQWRTWVKSMKLPSAEPPPW